MAAKMPVEATHAESWMVYPEDVIIIGRDTKDGAAHPRWRPDCKRQPAQGMIDSLRSEGQIQEVVVSKTRVKNDAGENVDRLELVVGCGRTIAARAINELEKRSGEDRRKIRVRLAKTADEDQMLVIEAENAVRKTVAPLERAKGAQRLLDAGIPIARVAVAYGVSPAAIRDGSKLLLAPKEAHQALADGKITTTHVISLAELPKEEQQAKLAGWLADPASLPTAKQALRETAQEKKAPAERAAKDAGTSGPVGRRQVLRVLKAVDAAVAAGKPSPISEKSEAILRALFLDDVKYGALPDEEHALLRWLHGSGSPKRVAGLSALLKDES